MIADDQVPTPPRLAGFLLSSSGHVAMPPRPVENTSNEVKRQNITGELRRDSHEGQGDAQPLTIRSARKIGPHLLAVPLDNLPRVGINKTPIRFVRCQVRKVVAVCHARPHAHRTVEHTGPGNFSVEEKGGPKAAPISCRR